MWTSRTTTEESESRRSMSSEEICPVCLQEYVNRVQAGASESKAGVDGIKVRDDHVTCVVKKTETYRSNGLSKTKNIRDIYVHER